MDKQFYARSNFTALLQVLNETLESKYGVAFNQISSNKELFKIMNTIHQRYGNNVKSITELNKRVIDVSLPLFSKTIDKKRKAIQNDLTNPVPMADQGSMASSGGPIIAPATQAISGNGFRGIGGIGGSVPVQIDPNSMLQSGGVRVVQRPLKSEIDLDSEFEQRQHIRNQEVTGGLGSQPPVQIDFTKPIQGENAPSMESSELLYQQAMAKRNQVPIPTDASGGEILPPQMREQITRAELNHNSNVMQNPHQIDGQDPRGNTARETLISDIMGGVSVTEEEVVAHPNLDMSQVLGNSGIGDIQTGVMLERNQNFVPQEMSNNPQELFRMQQLDSRQQEVGIIQEQRSDLGGIDRGVSSGGVSSGGEEGNVSNVLSMLEEKLNMLNKTMSENYKFPPEVIPPPKVETRLKTHYITIDSRDRDFEIYPNANTFQVKFGPPSSSKVKGIYRDKNNNLIYEANNIEIVGETGATIPNVLKNIKYIQCVQVIVPHTPTYVCGGCPYYYNNYQVDRNLTTVSADAATGQFSSYPYGPIRQVASDSTDVIGLLTNVLDEPYLLLCIDELDQTYNGTSTSNRNAFAKLVHDNYYGTLTAFVQMRPAENGPFLYEPFPLANIDKLTLRLLKGNNIPYDFGRDMLFIQKYEEGTSCVNFCGTTSKTTKITIISNTSFYNNMNTSNHITHYEPSDNGECSSETVSIQHCLRPGNKIYIYDTFPCETEIIRFHQNVKVLDVDPLPITYSDSGATPSYTITAYVDVTADDISYVDFSAFMNTGDYLYMNNIPYSVTEFETGDLPSISVSKISGEVGSPDPDINNLSSIQLAFSRKNRKGVKSHNKRSINYVDGWRVCSTYNTTTTDTVDPRVTFEIDYPYDLLPDRLKGNSVGNNHYESFLIKHQLQVSYTFKVVTVDPDFAKLDATIV